jgi:hypothetical protein
MGTLAFGVKVLKIEEGSVTLLPLIIDEETGNVIWTADEGKDLVAGEALAGSAPVYEEDPDGE